MRCTEATPAGSEGRGPGPEGSGSDEAADADSGPTEGDSGPVGQAWGRARPCATRSGRPAPGIASGWVAGLATLRAFPVWAAQEGDF